MLPSFYKNLGEWTPEQTTEVHLVAYAPRLTLHRQSVADLCCLIPLLPFDPRGI